MRTIDPAWLAAVEERRQAVGTADLVRESEPVGGGIMSYEAPGSWANQACGLGFEGPVGTADFDRLIAFYTGRDARPRIEVAPYTHPSLIEGLAARGFVLTEFEHVYATALDAAEDMLERIPSPRPSGVEIEVLSRTNDRLWREYADVASSGFKPRLQDDGTVLDMTDRDYEFHTRMLRHERTTSIVAVHDGRVVGAAAMELTPELCCLFGGCVLPEFRGRGIQLLMMAERMAVAQRAGCTIAVTHCNPGIATERNCLRLGKTLAYTKVVLEAPVGSGQHQSPSS